MKNQSFLGLCTVIAIFILPAISYAERLSEKEKKDYKEEGTYVQIFENPKDYVKKKLVLGVIFQSTSLKLPKPYDELVSNCSSINIENPRPTPILFSTNKNEDLRKAIGELPPGKLVKLYGSITIKTKTSKKAGQDSEKCYYFDIDDVETVSTEKTQDKAMNSVTSENYTEVDFRRLDIQFQKFHEKKVKFNVGFKDIDNRIPADLVKLSNISEDKNFQLLTSEPFHTLIIIGRDNEEAVNAIVNIKVNSKLTVYGTLKSVFDPSMKKDRPLYYIDVQSIKEYVAVPVVE